MSRSILPSGVEASRQGLSAWFKALADHYEEQVEAVYVKEMEILLNDIIQHTPIATGAAAGVEYNLVGSAHVKLTKSHPAYNLNRGNEPGDSGWQLHVSQTKDKLVLSLTNPMWEPYLQYLEAGIVTPADGRAESHFVRSAWQRFKARQSDMSQEIDDA